MARIERQQAEVFYAPTSGRRYLTKEAACRAEARAQLNARCADDICETWHWSDLEYYITAYERLTNALMRRLSQ